MSALASRKPCSCAFFRVPKSVQYTEVPTCNQHLLVFYRRVQKWVSYVHPGAHTLGIASTQRVESTNSALKQVLKRSGTMVDVDRAIIGRAQEDATKTAR